MSNCLNDNLFFTHGVTHCMFLMSSQGSRLTDKTTYPLKAEHLASSSASRTEGCCTGLTGWAMQQVDTC